MTAKAKYAKKEVVDTDCGPLNSLTQGDTKPKVATLKAEIDPICSPPDAAKKK